MVESASTGRARAAAELVAAGAVTHLARRVRSLLTPEGDLAAETSAESESAEDRTEARALAARASVDDSKRRPALLAEATRGGVAVDAVVRAFLAGWKGNLGTRPAPEVEACVEELANADLANAEVRIFARGRHGIGVDDREGDIAADDDDERASPSTTTTTSAPPTSIVSALRAKLTYLPAATRATTSARGIARVLEIDPPDPNAPSRRFLFRILARPQKASSTPMDVADENGELDDVEPWGGSDAGERRGDDHRRTRRAALAYLARGDERPRRLMREDPMAQGGGDVGSNDATNALESSPESVRGGVAVFLAKDGDWSAHEAMVKQAPRLAHLAQSRGAVGALFLWPDGAPGRPPVQPLLANPNYDIALGIPVATLPARDFDAVLSSSAAGWIVSIAPAGEGSTTTVARRCGDALAEACAFRPGAGAAGASARASSGAGRVAGLAKMRAKAAAARREAAAAAEEEEERAKAKAKTTGKGSSTAGGDGASAKGDGGDGWSWSKYLGLGGGGAKEGEDVVTTGSAEANGDAMDVEEKVEGEVQNEADANDVDLAAEGREPDLEPEPEPFDAFESARARRWSAAMRIAYALGDAGKEILWRAYPSPPEGAGAVRVLCLDGGGIRGLATIVMLERVMRAAGAWCVGECFDLIVGTSTGGVIALGAGLLRLTLKEVGELYDEMASEVFKPDGYYEFFAAGRATRRRDHSNASWATCSAPRRTSRCTPPPRIRDGTPRGARREERARGVARGGPPRVFGVLARVENPSHALFASIVPPTRRRRRHRARGRTPRRTQARGCTRAASHHRRAVVHGGTHLAEGARTRSCDSPQRRRRQRGCDVAERGGHRRERRRTRRDSAERASRGTMEPADASRAEATLRCIDGAMACNNPTAVGIFEARRLFSRDRPLVVVSLGTGAGTPCETETDYRDVGNIMNNIRNATCDVLQVAATVRHVLGEEDQYFRFQPTDEIFSCDLAESKEETRLGTKSGRREVHGHGRHRRGGGEARRAPQAVTPKKRAEPRVCRDARTRRAGRTSPVRKKCRLSRDGRFLPSSPSRHAHLREVSVPIVRVVRPNHLFVRARASYPSAADRARSGTALDTTSNASSCPSAAKCSPSESSLPSQSRPDSANAACRSATGTPDVRPTSRATIAYDAVCRDERSNRDAGMPLTSTVRRRRSSCNDWRRRGSQTTAAPSGRSSTAPRSIADLPRTPPRGRRSATCVLLDARRRWRPAEPRAGRGMVGSEERGVRSVFATKRDTRAGNGTRTRERARGGM